MREIVLWFRDDLNVVEQVKEKDIIKQDEFKKKKNPNFSIFL